MAGLASGCQARGARGGGDGAAAHLWLALLPARGEKPIRLRGLLPKLSASLLGYLRVRGVGAWVHVHATRAAMALLMQRAVRGGRRLRGVRCQDMPLRG